jgi:hypothetical protein
MAERDQAERRAWGIFTDQHGREWESAIERDTGHPVGMMPTPRFTAPWYPHAKYLTIDPVNDRKFHIDYQQMLVDHSESTADYEDASLFFAREMYGSKFAEALANPTPELLKAVGMAPKGREYIEAAAEGNPWVLGLDPDMPQWAKALEEAMHPYGGKKYPTAKEERDGGPPITPPAASPRNMPRFLDSLEALVTEDA